ncbi:flagellin [Actibacterium ureilyticum]|uniref:flagellin n=1 Tax=Actibacterium ureilyticum TaxID=1590614 RepID=UPI0015961180|nr:flagellin [Actibacterium ureilyticum]
MTWISTATLARSFVLSQQNKALSAQIGQLSQELGTGQVADIGRKTGGDYAPLAQIRHELGVLNGFDTATQEATLRAGLVQNSLTQIGDTADQLAGDLLIASNLEKNVPIETAGLQARNTLEQIVSALNVTGAGQSLFAGAATDQPAIASADTLLTALKAEVAGLTTANDVLDAVDAWFDVPGGGYDTVGYLGADTPVGAVRLSQTQSMALSVSANDTGIREVLKSVAAAALAEDPNLMSGDLTERSALIAASANRVLNATPHVTALSGEVGVAQNKIETIQAENATKRYALELAQNDITGADPYDTATRLQAVETQLQTHYTITARLSALSLVDYLR